MKKNVFTFGIAAGLLLAISIARADDRQVLNFNPAWKFLKANPTNAFSPNFDDSQWTNVSTPHTYNDTDTFDNFDLPGLRGETNQWNGKTWYRKTFDAPKDWRGKKIYIQFDAVRQVAQVYLNGHYLGACKNGFLPFGFDLTPYLKIGKPNVLAVMCDNQFSFNPMTAGNEGRGRRGGGRRRADSTNAVENVSTNSATAEKKSGTNNAATVETWQGQLAREATNIPVNVDDLEARQVPWNNPQWHPAMGGIYRDVKLIVTDPLHISLPLYDFLQTEGPYIYSTDISEKSATVNVDVPVENGRSSNEQVAVAVTIEDENGKPVAAQFPSADANVTAEMEQTMSIAAGKSAKQKFSFVIPSPQLWEPDYPYLYHAVITLNVDGKVVDLQEIPFGIRAVHWDVKTGFSINGNPLRIHGWGQKPIDEWPGLGDAMPDWMHFYSLLLMKDAGANWVRWGHCAGGPAQIQACDELGLMVEQPGVDGEADTVRAAWDVRADAFRAGLIFYRNNPSIMIWEGGNQHVTDEHAKQLRGYFDEYDPSGGRAYAHRRADQTTGKYMDVTIGTEGSHEVPRLPVVEGEYDREESPRRVWDEFTPPFTNYDALQKAAKQTYAEDSEEFAVSEIKNYVRKLSAPGHSGGANWIFSDSTSGGRNTTEVDRASGEVDGVRLPKEAYYVCQTMFRDDPQIHIIGHWNYPVDTVKNVYVASNCKDVELFVNGKSLGHGKNSMHYLFTFENVAFAPGEIKAVGYDDGKAVATYSIRTAGSAVALRMTPVLGPNGLLANGSDVALVDVEAIDANGERVPTFQRRVDFNCAGPAIWRGGYNSGKTNTINNKFLDLEAGINRIAVRSTLKAGKIIVTANCPGLKPASITIASQKFPRNDGYSKILPLMPLVQSPQAHASWANLTEAVPPITTTAFTGTEAKAGNYIEALAYTGPTEGARVLTNAMDGAKIYSDADFTFTNLPAELVGADYVQVPNADALYAAVDLIQLGVTDGTNNIYIAHDVRATAPGWLTNQFRAPTNMTISTITVNGQTMQLWRRTSNEESSSTLGSNTDDDTVKEANAYIVFVAPVPVAPKEGESSTNSIEKTSVKSENENAEMTSTNAVENTSTNSTP